VSYELAQYNYIDTRQIPESFLYKSFSEANTKTKELVLLGNERKDVEKYSLIM
jgi:hypothetical protein